MKLLKNPIILMVFGILFGGGAAFAGWYFYGEKLGLKAPAEVQVKYVERPTVGIAVPLKERIVNLADPGVTRYLKVTLVLELMDRDDKTTPTGEAYKKKQDELQKSLTGQWPMVDDTVTTILSNATTAQLLSADGKEDLRARLKGAINRVFERVEPDPLTRPEVLRVYFSDFVVQ